MAVQAPSRQCGSQTGALDCGQVPILVTEPPGDWRPTLSELLVAVEHRGETAPAGHGSRRKLHEAPELQLRGFVVLLDGFFPPLPRHAGYHGSAVLT